MRRHARLFLLAVLLLFSCALPAAGFDKVWIIKSADSEQYREIASMLSLGINARCTSPCSTSNIKTINPDELAQISSSDRNLIVTLGTKAYETVKQLPVARIGQQAMLYHTLLPLDQAPSGTSTAFFWLEQSPATQLDVLERLFGNKRKIFLFYSDDSEWRIADWEKSAAKSRLRITFEKIRPRDIGTVLSSDRLNGQAVVLLPDKTIYNRFTLKQILLAGYMNQLALVGYSRSLSKSGAAASIITDLEPYLLETASHITQIIASGTLPGNRFPQDWKVILNSEISDTLNLQIDKSRFDNNQLEELQP